MPEEYITTSTQDVTNAALYSNYSIEVFCECCESQDAGTLAELTGRDWTFSSGAQFCGRCSF